MASNRLAQNYFTALTIFKLMRLKEPEYTLKLFTRYESDRPTRGLRVDLRLPRVTSDIGRTSFRVQLRNSVPALFVHFLTCSFIYRSHLQACWLPRCTECMCTRIPTARSPHFLCWFLHWPVTLSNQFGFFNPRIQ